MRILIVDDDEIFLDKIEKILVLEQHTIVTAVSGEEALLKLENNQFDLILTDLKMPKISGIELIKIIKEKGIDSIIIVITGYGSIESAVESMKAGAYDYILKPFEISSLKNKIKEVETEIEIKKEPLLVNPVFSELKKLVLHPIRRNIVILLKSEKQVEHNEINERLNVDGSSNLDFHIKKLIRENIIKKDEKYYSLSPTGVLLTDIITQIENLGHSYPHS